jgi:hypothetical protein
MMIARRSICTHLGLVESGTVDFLVEGLGDGGALQDAVLAEEKPVLKSEFGEREADDQLLPGEEWPVQPAGQALEKCLDHAVCVLSGLTARGRVEDTFEGRRADLARLGGPTTSPRAWTPHTFTLQHLNTQHQHVSQTCHEQRLHCPHWRYR